MCRRHFFKLLQATKILKILVAKNFQTNAGKVFTIHSGPDELLYSIVFHKISGQGRPYRLNAYHI